MLANSGTGNQTSYGMVYMGTPYGMATPIDFSYVCTRSYFLLKSDAIKVTKIALYINYFQFQPFGLMPVNGTTDYAYGKVNYCQGFFSSGIWMAISALIIMFIILAYGVLMLTNINTMDRFDDPKGKPLAIALEK